MLVTIELINIYTLTGIVLGRDIEIFSHIFPKKSHCYFEMTNFYHWNLIRICAILELVWNSPVVLQVQAYPCTDKYKYVLTYIQIQ